MDYTPSAAEAPDLVFELEAGFKVVPLQPTTACEREQRVIGDT